jgi:GH25 family lysozyme M1 (1,4-beta-N-acetylmuramidase)
MKATKKKTKINIPVVVAIIVIIGIISSIIVISNNRREPQIPYSFGKSVANGIDVSEHNGDIDWDEVSKTQDFAFIRVGYRGYGNGEIIEDKNAKENLKNAIKAGLPVGVYFYTQAVTEKEAEQEADFVYSIIKKFDIELPVIIDFEYPTDSDGNATGRLVDADNSANDNAKIINSFTSKLANKGYITGVYASSSVLAHKISTKKLNSDTVVWVADYNDSVTFDVDYTIWQYTETGSCDGVSSKHVDQNYWYE